MNKTLVQVLVTLILTIPSLQSSFAVVWPSYSLPQLESATSPLGYPITKRDGDLVGSITMLGSLLATIVGGYISDAIGRKKSEQLCGLFIILGWAVIVTAKTTMQLLAGRLITGVGFGIHLVVALVYISEISEPLITGTLTTILTFVFSSGMLFSYILGWLCSYELICYTNLLLSVLFVALVCLIKDSPTFLLGKGMEKEALQSLMFYRGARSATKEVLHEFAYIRNQRNSVNNRAPDMEKSDKEVEAQKLNEEDNNVDKNLDIGPWELLRSCRTSRRTVVILAVNVNLTVLMGMTGVQAYAGSLFQAAVPALSPHLCSVALALVLVAAGALAMVITDLVDRRVLMLLSCGLSTTCLVVLGSLLRWAWAPQWALPLVMVLYCVGYQIGINNIPYVQIGESLTPQMKSLGAAIIYCIMFIAHFIVLLLFGPAVALVGLDGAFFIFAGNGVIVTTVLFFLMRETRKIPFDVIQDMYAQGYLYRKKHSKYVAPGNM